jgi:hypothetical protein
MCHYIKNTVAPSKPIFTSKVELSQDVENVASSVKGTSQADEQST